MGRASAYYVTCNTIMKDVPLSLKILRLTVTAVMTAVCVAVVAQPYCKIRTFTISDGLAANRISAFAQSADGMMWVATWNGLCCYDGYSFSNFKDTQDAGRVLTSNRIRLIRPNSRSDIWIATYDGNAYLFDCTTCRFIDVDRLLRAAGARSFVVRSIVSLPNGQAWLIGNGHINFHIDESKVKSGGGITLVDTRKMRFKTSIHKVEADSRGREWVFMGQGVSIYGTGRDISYPFEYKCETGGEIYLASKSGTLARYAPDRRGGFVRIVMPAGVRSVSDMTATARGIVALATDRGVVMLDAASGRTRLVSVAPAGAGEAVSHVFADSRGRVWAFTSERGVTLISADGGSVTRLDTPPLTVAGITASVPVVHEDGNNVVWTVPAGGVLSYYDERSGRLVPCNAVMSAGRSMLSNTIQKYISDTQGNLWFTGDHNLTLVSFKYHRFLFTPIVLHDDTRAVAYGRDGSVWTGTMGGRLALRRAGSSELLYVSRDGSLTSVPVCLSVKGVYAIHEDRRGTLWIGTKGDGLFTLTPDGGRYKVRRYSRSETDPRSLSGDNIYDMMEQDDGRMWVGTYGAGLNIAVRKPDGTLEFVNSRSGLKPFRSSDYRNIRKLTMTADGTIIAATTGGMVTFSSRFRSPADIRYHYSTHVQGDTASLYAADVLNVYVCRRTGHVYASTMGGGFQQVVGGDMLRDGLRFRGVSGINPDEGMVLSMLEDSLGNLWLVRESSVNMIDAKTGKVDVYGPNDWDDDVEFTEAKPAVTSSGGEVMLGVVGGYMTFSPQKMRKSTYKPSIVFSGARFQGEQNVTPLLGNSVLEVPAGKDGVTVYFAALDYSDNRLIRYAYRIKELDRQWSYTGTEHSAPLTHIQPGLYTLEVMSTNSDGVWTDNPRTLKIRVMPTFWESGWAWLIYIAAASCVGFALLYVWRLRQKATLERRIQERQLTFFTDISHQLRTPLTLISGPVSQVLDEEPLSVKARTYLEFVRKNTARMLELVDKALDLKKLHTLNSELEAQSAAVTATVSDGSEDLVAQPSSPDDAVQGDRTRMLIVEDNDELRYFLVSSLDGDYTVSSARNGKEGLEKAVAEQPDFIITDIMMPVMDGMEMIRRIKADASICHIPIIVLSARTAMSSRIEGLNEGIDDYITKPFSVAYLKSRVANIIRQRRQLQQAWLDKLNVGAAADSQDDGVKPSMPELSGADKEFADKLLAFIDSHVADPELKIDDVAKAMAVSRTVLYGKVKSFSGMSPVDFVRHVRILKAEKLVAGSKMSFSEIAYATGFADPKYFSRTFKAKTGLTPSEFRKKS